MSHQGDCFTLPNLNPLGGLAALFSNRVLILLKPGNRYMLELTIIIKKIGHKAALGSPAEAPTCKLN